MPSCIDEQFADHLVPLPSDRLGPQNFNETLGLIPWHDPEAMDAIEEVLVIERFGDILKVVFPRFHLGNNANRVTVEIDPGVPEELGVAREDIHVVADRLTGEGRANNQDITIGALTLPLGLVEHKVRDWEETIQAKIP